MDAQEAKEVTLRARLEPRIEEYNIIKQYIRLYAERGMSKVKIQNLSAVVLEQLKYENYKITRFTGDYLWTIEW